jgi:RHH-type proline utilization regulon transcriptional repressor/proline dehydrogenase/delta 1-pyrroline-5-carboxylate dehydrogenase
MTPVASVQPRLDPAAVEVRTQAIGRALFARVRRYRPTALEALGDRAMALLARDDRFRARLLRFIDALASLEDDRGGRHVRRLLHEYLGGGDAEFPGLPAWLRALVPVVASEAWPAPLVAAVARTATRTFASRFIASTAGDRGKGEPGALAALRELRRLGRYPSFDVLGEYVASEREADAYCEQYLALLSTLASAPESERRTAGGVHALQVSVKVSALTADFNPIDPNGTLVRVRPRLLRIADTARRLGLGITLDMERYETRDLVLHIFYALFGPGAELGGWDGIGVVLQAYLRDADAQAQQLLAFAERRGVPFQVRLVKGAYWDYETVVARENGWPVPVWEEKAETDRCFERLSERLIGAWPAVRPAIASHNLRSHAHAEALREKLGQAPGTVEHQTLFRTAEGTARALAAMGWPCRDYVPLGELLPGMAYLVRRILENSSQVGFLLQSRSGEAAEQLLAQPVGHPQRDDHEAPLATAVSRNGHGATVAEPPDEARLHAFRNQPPPRLFLAAEREAFAAELETVRQEFGREYPLRLGDAEQRTADLVPVTDPSHPEVVIGRVHNAGTEEVRRTLALASEAAEGWAARTVQERAAVLRRAAELMAARREVLAAWIVHEAAKSWEEAFGDVDEAIDYLRYYAIEAEALAEEWTEYRPRGVVAVIPPWNFPIAIPCGMTSAALVAGNAVILKPAEQTPLIAWRLAEVLHGAGVPRGALTWLPGRGEVAGAALVSSPAVDMVAFTGSRAVGTAIYREGSRVRPDRGGLRATVAEMGGKNAIVVFPEADLDEAVPAILRSAFGHANQKCSAASRVLAHSAVYERLRRRLVEGADSLPVGAADDPGTLVTPLIDGEARERVRKAAAEARREGRLLLDDLDKSGDSAAYGPVLVEVPPGRAARAHTTQEEIFGPVLALVPFRDEAEALRIANGTPYALTGGIFSRSPGTVARLSEELDAGNLYVNRAITGARVGVEPFGGYKLSGTGPKAGGPEYLWAFITRRAGLRAGGALPQGSATPQPEALRPWDAPVERRAERLRAALASLRGERRERWNALAPEQSLAVVERLLQQLPEIAVPHATVPLPGQQTVARWDTPRGCGLVLVDEGAPPESLPALICAALLAGNGVALVPDQAHRKAAALLVQALHAAGVPRTALVLAPENPDLAAAIALPQITFAAADLAAEAIRSLYALLADAGGTPDSPHLKSLITLADGPGPEQPGFLRRFALPKTVAVRTLHLGADLELVDVARHPQHRS